MGEKTEDYRSNAHEQCADVHIDRVVESAA
jgi:hypothetical protein